MVAGRERRDEGQHADAGTAEGIPLLATRCRERAEAKGGWLIVCYSVRVSSENNAKE